MSDVLIRDVSPAVVRLLDEQAQHLRLSRSEFLRRHLTELVGLKSSPALTDESWASFDAAFSDLDDEHVMAQAWQ